MLTLHIVGLGCLKLINEMIPATEVQLMEPKLIIVSNQNCSL